ncbi:MAG: hypothetical protein HFJ12_01625 [Bacilli bacterium]|nr:hypothetical protein [Bacilli bacterium]
MDNKFETEVLTRLAVIESKLDGYKEIKKITYLNEQKCNQNIDDINDLKSRVNDLEKKPTKRYDNVVAQIISFVVNAILIIVAIKIGLK